MANEIDLARLAAYIDGEGCIQIIHNGASRGGFHFILDVEISNTDARLISWLVRTFGGHVCRGKTPKGRPMFNWHVSSRAAKVLLEQCFPYFVIKAEQARIALEFCKLMKPAGYYNSRRRQPESLIAEKLRLKNELIQSRAPVQILQ